jgi:hypothetical protein
MPEQDKLALELEQVGQHVDQLRVSLHSRVAPDDLRAEVDQPLDDYLCNVGSARASEESQVVY